MASFVLTKDNKFKPGDIITNFKEPTWYFRPVEEWKLNINTNSATWKVISIDDKNGDYKLQRLDTLTAKRLLEGDGPIYQPEQIMSKNLIDNGDYRLWAKDDVNAINNSVVAKVEEEKKNHNMAFEKYKNGMTDDFNQSKSIAETATKYNIDKEEVWDIIDKDKLEDATDYDSVKEEVQKINSSTKKGGKKSKKRKTKRSKKRETKRSKKGRTTLRSRTTRRNSSYKL